MKKVWLMLAILVCIFASCSDGGSDNPVNPTPKPEEVKTEITIDSGIVSNGLSFGVAEGEQSVSFSVNANWTLSIASTTSGATWCKASVTSGNKGTTNVKFTVEENTGYDDRSVSVTIKAGSVSKTFTITQKGVDALLLTTTKYEVPQEGGQIEIEVKANIDYQMEISKEDKSWITEVSSRTLTTYRHKLNIALNEDAVVRDGKITFKSGDKVETVKVYQAGGAIILLSQNEYAVSDAGDTISVDIKSNIDFGVQMPDVDWIIDEASSRGMSSHTLKYIITANEGYDSRSADIIFYDKNSDLKDTLKVVQAQKDAIVISEKNISVAQEGGMVEVKVSTNVDFEVQIPFDATWISQKNSRVLTEKCIYLKVAENTGDDDREAKIVFINKDSRVYDSVILSQSGFKGSYINGVATIVKAGTMREVLGEDYMNITSLRVIGAINGTDIRTLREMAGSDVDGNNTNGLLQILNISECNIVEGGESYIFSKYTTNNIVGASMFQNCSSLKELYLPKTVTKMEEFALANCTQLKVFDIPKSIIALGKRVFENCSSLDELIIPGNINSWSTLGNTSINSVVIESGVKYIPYEAFRECVNLKKITIPKTVTLIYSRAFHYPNEIEAIYVDDLEQWLNYYWARIHDYPLVGDNGSLYINEKKIKEITIPNTYTSIPQYAFYGCTNIEAITLPNTLESIGEYAFSKTNIKRIEIPNNVKEIGEGAFSGCSELEKVKMSNMVTRIPNDCFYGCKKLKFQIPNYIQFLDSSAFENCESLEEITIPDGVDLGNNSIFSGCINVKRITLPSTLTFIGASVFGNLPVDVVYCYAVSPPELSNYRLGNSTMNFKCVDKNTAILYVPKDCIQTYKESEWGECFKNIKEIEN